MLTKYRSNVVHSSMCNRCKTQNGQVVNRSICKWPPTTPVKQSLQTMDISGMIDIFVFIYYNFLLCEIFLFCIDKKNLHLRNN